MKRLGKIVRLICGILTVLFVVISLTGPDVGCLFELSSNNSQIELTEFDGQGGTPVAANAHHCPFNCQSTGTHGHSHNHCTQNTNNLCLHIDALTSTNPSFFGNFIAPAAPCLEVSKKPPINTAVA